MPGRTWDAFEDIMDQDQTKQNILFFFLFPTFWEKC